MCEQGQPFVVSPLLGQTLKRQISGQTKKTQTWTLVLSIPQSIIFLCGMTSVLVMLVRVLPAK
jgi:hypothetical protein